MHLKHFNHRAKMPFFSNDGFIKKIGNYAYILDYLGL